MPPTESTVRRYGGFRSIAPPSPRPSSDPADAVRWWKERIDKPLFVYVIQDGDDGPVKIGKAFNPPGRLAELQCGNPRALTLHAVVIAHYSSEDDIHRLWGRFHVRGEWYGNYVRPAGKPDRYGMGMVTVQPADHPNVQETVIRLARETQEQQITAMLDGTLHVLRHRDTDRHYDFPRALLPARNEDEQVRALGNLAARTLTPPTDWPALETWPKVPR